MKYLVKMCDLVKDEALSVEIEAPSVFDAIDQAAISCEHPADTELISAEPVL